MVTRMVMVTRMAQILKWLMRTATQTDFKRLMQKANIILDTAIRVKKNWMRTYMPCGYTRSRSRLLHVLAATNGDDDRSFIVLTETKFSLHRCDNCFSLLRCC